MHYLIYQVTNTKNGKIYIGCHQTVDPDDGYMGSGTLLKRAVAKHGIDSFTKTILHDFDSPEAMFAKEAELVTEEFIARDDNYNLKIGGFGGWDYINNNQDIASRCTNTKNATKQLIALWKDPKWSAKERTRRSIQRKTIFDEYPEKRAAFANAFKGKKHTTETLAVMSQKAKFRIQNSHPTKGKKWIKKDGINKLVLPSEISTYLQDGWTAGKTQSK